MAARDSRALGRVARDGGGSYVGGRRGVAAGLVGAAGLYRPLETLYAVVDAATSQHAVPVGVGRAAVAEAVALVGARGDGGRAATLGAGLVGATLLGALATVALVGRVAALGPGAVAVGAAVVLAVAAMAALVAAWTVRAARSRPESLLFGAPAAFPLLAGPWFAAFAPEAVPAVGAAGAPAVLADAAALALSGGVVHGCYRRSLALLALRSPDAEFGDDPDRA